MYERLIVDESLRVVFNLVRREPGVRFSAIARKTGLHDPDVADAIRVLKSQDLVWATTIPTKGARVFFSYELAPRGKRAAMFLDQLAESATKGKFRGDQDAKHFANLLEATKV
jgi:predicted transcriptional regulator